MAMNIVQIHGQWQTIHHITSEQDKCYLLQHYPSLCRQMTLDTPLLQWLAIVHHPEYVEQGSMLPEIRHTLTFAKSPTSIQ